MGIMFQKTLVLNNIDKVMGQIKDSLNKCDEIAKFTPRLRREPALVGVAMKHIALAGEVFNSCRAMTLSFMLGLSVQGNGFTSGGVFGSARITANTFLQYMGALEEVVLRDNNFKGGSSRGVLQAYTLKVKQF